MFILYLIGRNILLYTWNFQFILYILDTDIKFFIEDWFTSFNSMDLLFPWRKGFNS